MGRVLISPQKTETLSYGVVFARQKMRCMELRACHLPLVEGSATRHCGRMRESTHENGVAAGDSSLRDQARSIVHNYFAGTARDRANQSNGP